VPAIVPGVGDEMHLTLDDVLAASVGVGPGIDRRRFRAVSTDSRRHLAGRCSWRWGGLRGHDFVVRRWRWRGAAAVVDQAQGHPSATRARRRHLEALGDLAAWGRRRPPRGCDTGSNGKTTTKDLIAAMCAGAGWRVLKTEGNLNNLIGLPLTVLGARGDEAIRVLEMGMNRRGEIARLTEIARPDFAVVTNVGPAHLDGVGGTLAGVAAAKGELFAGLSPGASIAVNGDDAWVRRIAMPFAGRKVVFGTGGEVRARNVRDVGGDGLAFTLVVAEETADLHLRLVGAHNVTNALAAAAVGHAMGLRVDTIAQGLARAEGPAMRMQARRLANGVTVIDDAYNANPSSMEAALQALTRLPGRAVAVVGEMRELGDEGRRAHHVLVSAPPLGVVQLVVLGSYAEAVVAGAGGSMPRAAVRVTASHATRSASWSRSGNPATPCSQDRGQCAGAVVRLLGTPGTPGDAVSPPVSCATYSFNVFRYITFRALIASLTALALSLLLGPWLIRGLTARQIGQTIRPDGPQRHLAKAGTPTMGGTLILFSLIVATLLLSDLTNPYVWLVVAVTAAYGVIGFTDDYRKLKRGHGRGLSGRAKLAGQTAVAVIAAVVLWPRGLQHGTVFPVLQGSTPEPRLGLCALCRPRDRRHVQRREPDRRARWPGHWARHDQCADIRRVCVRDRSRQAGRVPADSIRAGCR
jgi:UDP-N-acetylmuramoyl-tripeptide--D-alanyl-D-alanine ligase